MSTNYKLKVKEVIKETADAITIVFEDLEQPIQYLSGQFLTLIATINGEEVRRAYSLCSSAHANENPAVTVKRVKGGVMSNYLNDNLKAGDEIDILEPMGNFKIEPDESKARNVVLFGGGSGITPMFSILKTTLLKEPNSKVTLVFANETDGSIIFKSHLADWQSKYADRLTVVHHIDDELVDTQQKKKGLGGLFGKKETVKANQGYLTQEKLQRVLSDNRISANDTTEFFMCGPNGMMKVVEATLSSMGAKRELTHKEVFVVDLGDTHKVTDEGVKEVTVILKGETHKVKVEKQAILFEALEQGLDVPFSCQAGLCTACMGKCTSGKVEMEIADALTDEQIKDGYVLTCVGHAKSDDVVIDFD